VAAFTVNETGTSSDSLLSTSVTIELNEWEFDVVARKKFGDGTSAPPQTVTVGWETQATHGWDEKIDVDLPLLTGLPSGPAPLPTGDDVPGGSFFSRGFSDDHTVLSTDIRPFGSSSTWYLYLDFGDNPTEVRIEWETPDLPRSDLPLLLAEVDEQNDFEVKPETLIDMMSENELAFDLGELDTTQRVRKVFRVQIGLASRSETLILDPGWTLVSFPMQPNDDDPDAVFANNTGKVIAGEVWGFRDGTYFMADRIEQSVGYWVYNPRDAAEHIVVSGFTADETVVLKLGWNLIGPTRNTVIPNNVLLKTDGTTKNKVFYFDNGVYQAAPEVDTGVEVEILKGYWTESDRERSLTFD
jgi:hypothetical protein